MPHSNAVVTEPKPCPLIKRLLAMVYDGLLLVGLWMIAAVAVVVPINQGVAPSTGWFQLYLLGITWLYFAVSWRRGCTLGMKAWHIRIEADKPSLSWPTTVVRFVVALASLGSFGLGFWWSVFRQDKATWHDLASNTRLIIVPKSASRQQ